MFLIAVALLCCDMLWYSWSVQRWTNLHWSAPRCALPTFTDNTALPGFLYFYTCSLNVSLHRIIISIHFPLIYAIWWPLTHSGVTRHLSHETRLGSRERDKIFWLFYFLKILNDEIYREKLSFIQLKNTKCKKCRCILKFTYTFWNKTYFLINYMQ